jgi:hypothetical protein
VGVDRSIEVDLLWTIEFDPRTSLGTPITVKQEGDPTIAPGDLVFASDVSKISGLGPRQYALHSVCENIQLRLNDQAFNFESAETVHALLNYGNDPEERQYCRGATAHYPDQVWRYDNAAGSRSPFVSYLNGTFEDSRNGSFWFQNARIDPSTGKARIDMRVIEHLMISPLTFGDEEQCLFGIQNIDLTLTFRQPLTRMLSGDLYESGLFTWEAPRIWAPGDKLNPTFSLLGDNAANLHITYLQPQAQQVIPFRLNYPYYAVRRYQTDSQGVVKAQDKAIGQGATPFQINYNNITLHEIPKRMYIYARPRPSQVAESGYQLSSDATASPDAVSQTDSFAAIERLTVNFDSQDGRLSTLDSYDLWKLSTRNGLKRSWVAWSRFYGSVLCLEFGKDLNLNPLLAPGVRGNFQLSMEVTYSDLRRLTDGPFNTDDVRFRTDQTYRGYLIIVPVGVVTIENQLITTSIGSVTEEQVLSAPWAEAGLRIAHSGLYGGKWYKSVWQAVKKGAKAAAPILGALAPIASTVLQGMNDPRAQMAGQVIGAVHGATRGMGRRSGGKSVRCASLSRRM